MVAFALRKGDYRPVHAADAGEAQAAIADQVPDLILLDWMLPGTSGLELARRWRREALTREVPIIMLTARGEENDRVSGLESGVDDYVVEPVSARELLARIRAGVRGARDDDEDGSVAVGPLRIDGAAHRVFAGEVPVQLGPTEYRLLHFFMTHVDRVYSRTQLLDHVWGGNVYVEERTVDVQIRRLRKALEPHGLDAMVQAGRGAGYRFPDVPDRGGTRTTSGAATSTSRSARWTCRAAACARPWNRTAWTPWCRPCAAPATGSRTCRPERRRGPGMSLSLLLRLAWRQSLIRLLVFYALAVAIGLLLGELWWALGLATVLVAARAYWRLYRVLRFLDWRRQLKSVDGQGLWAALETLIHRRQTENRSRSRRLVRLLRGYRQAATATPDGALIVHRRDGRLVWFNQAARQLLGLRYPQSLDAPLAGLFPEEPRVRDWFAAGSSGEPLEDLAGP